MTSDRLPASPADDTAQPIDPPTSQAAPSLIISDVNTTASTRGSLTPSPSQADLPLNTASTDTPSRDTSGPADLLPSPYMTENPPQRTRAQPGAIHTVMIPSSRDPFSTDTPRVRDFADDTVAQQSSRADYVAGLERNSANATPSPPARPRRPDAFDIPITRQLPPFIPHGMRAVAAHGELEIESLDDDEDHADDSGSDDGIAMGLRVSEGRSSSQVIVADNRMKRQLEYDAEGSGEEKCEPQASGDDAEKGAVFTGKGKGKADSQADNSSPPRQGPCDGAYRKLFERFRQHREELAQQNATRGSSAEHSRPHTANVEGHSQQAAPAPGSCTETTAHVAAPGRHRASLGFDGETSNRRAFMSQRYDEARRQREEAERHVHFAAARPSHQSEPNSSRILTLLPEVQDVLTHNAEQCREALQRNQTQRLEERSDRVVERWSQVIRFLRRQQRNTALASRHLRLGHSNRGLRSEREVRRDESAERYWHERNIETQERVLNGLEELLRELGRSGGDSDSEVPAHSESSQMHNQAPVDVTHDAEPVSNHTQASAEPRSATRTGRHSRRTRRTSERDPRRTNRANQESEPDTTERQSRAEQQRARRAGSDPRRARRTTERAPGRANSTSQDTELASNEAQAGEERPRAPRRRGLSPQTRYLPEHGRVRVGFSNPELEHALGRSERQRDSNATARRLVDVAIGRVAARPDADSVMADTGWGRVFRAMARAQRRAESDDGSGDESEAERGGRVRHGYDGTDEHENEQEASTQSTSSVVAEPLTPTVDWPTVFSGETLVMPDSVSRTQNDEGRGQQPASPDSPVTVIHHSPMAQNPIHRSSMENDLNRELDSFSRARASFDQLSWGVECLGRDLEAREGSLDRWSMEIMRRTEGGEEEEREEVRSYLPMRMGRGRLVEICRSDAVPESRSRSYVRRAPAGYRMVNRTGAGHDSSTRHADTVANTSSDPAAINRTTPGASSQNNGLSVSSQLVEATREPVAIGFYSPSIQASAPDRDTLQPCSDSSQDAEGLESAALELNMLLAEDAEETVAAGIYSNNRAETERGRMANSRPQTAERGRRASLRPQREGSPHGELHSIAEIIEDYSTDANRAVVDAPSLRLIGYDPGLQNDHARMSGLLWEVPSPNEIAGLYRIPHGSVRDRLLALANRSPPSMRPSPLHGVGLNGSTVTSPFPAYIDLLENNYIEECAISDGSAGSNDGLPRIVATIPAVAVDGESSQEISTGNRGQSRIRDGILDGQAPNPSSGPNTSNESPSNRPDRDIIEATENMLRLLRSPEDGSFPGRRQAIDEAIEMFEESLRDMRRNRSPRDDSSRSASADTLVEPETVSTQVDGNGSPSTDRSRSEEMEGFPGLRVRGRRRSRRPTMYIFNSPLGSDAASDLAYDPDFHTDSFPGLIVASEEGDASPSNSTNAQLSELRADIVNANIRVDMTAYRLDQLEAAQAEFRREAERSQGLNRQLLAFIARMIHGAPSNDTARAAQGSSSGTARDLSSELRSTHPPSPPLPPPPAPPRSEPQPPSPLRPVSPRTAVSNARIETFSALPEHPVTGYIARPYLDWSRLQRFISTPPPSRNSAHETRQLVTRVRARHALGNIVRAEVDTSLARPTDRPSTHREQDLNVGINLVGPVGPVGNWNVDWNRAKRFLDDPAPEIDDEELSQWQVETRVRAFQALRSLFEAEWWAQMDDEDNFDGDEVQNWLEEQERKNEERRERGGEGSQGQIGVVRATSAGLETPKSS